MGAGSAPARVALVTNFIAPYRVPLFAALARRVGALRVFVSTPMEPNRAWQPDTGGLDVVAVRSFMLRRHARHPHAFREPLFVHLPFGAPGELRRFRPDVIVSGQLGLASLLAVRHCRREPGCALVLWLTLSEVSELGRGALRRALRRRLLARADAVMVNGESGARYVRSFGVPDDRIHRVYQAVDLARFDVAARRSPDARRRLLFVGSGEPRKGLAPFLEHLGAWGRRHPDRRVELVVAGVAAGALAAQPSLPDNVAVRWLGHVDYAAIPGVYADVGLLVFPTLADEWGLVVNEALAAGLPVLGSRYSQAVLELVEDGASGWTFRPDDAADCDAALERALGAGDAELARMGERGRERIAALSVDAVADRMAQAIEAARLRRGPR